MKIGSLLFGVAIGAGIFSFVVLNKTQTLENKKEVRVNNQIIIAEVVKTDKARERGLSGRESIGVNEGMLFEYLGNEQVTFWMKDMKFPIDIVWIRDGIVIGFEQNVDPQVGVSEDMLNRYNSPEPITQVLELQAGRAKTLRLFVGAHIVTKPLVQ
ncbi:MAG: hypothetical protein LiPW41_214 [Parcubacteria group bacterium LiPW_41]|nr:MAG: hypothetical protein LiPW41_214 [Parcubacteria group bacterium LiPW_41]